MQNSSCSSDSSSTVTVESNQLHQGHTPNYNPAEWDVLTDADSLDTAYDDAINRYGRQVTAKLTKKREREKISRKS